MKKIMVCGTFLLFTTSVFAMDALSDDVLGSATGQDGITVQLIAADTGGGNYGLTIDNVILHDKDGYDTAGQAGALVLGKGESGTNLFRVKTDSSGIIFKIDADGGAAGNAPYLNISVTAPTLVISTGDVYVAGSKRAKAWVGTSGRTTSADRSFDASTANGGSGEVVKIFDTFDVDLSGMKMNFQLGNAVQSSLFSLQGQMNQGFGLSNFALNDTNGYVVSSGIGTGDAAPGQLKIGKLTFTDANASALNLDIGVNVNHKGLAVSLQSATKTDLALERLSVGAATGAPALGDIAILGIDAQGTVINISGH